MFTVNRGQGRTHMPRQRQAAADDAGTGALWFSPPDSEQNRRRAITRDRVVAEALAIISAGGASALSMRVLATRLGVVPAALYHHVTSKEQLYDLILDGVLAEVECQADPALPWTGQVTALAHRLRTVLEDHPGIAALLKTRDPLSPASLALAEAFLAPLHAAGLPGRQAAWAFRLIYDSPSASRSATPPHPAGSASRTPLPEPSCTPSCAPFPPAGSPRWPPSARTPGPTTATSGSPPASTPSSPACRRLTTVKDPLPRRVRNPGDYPWRAAKRATTSPTAGSLVPGSGTGR